MLELQYRLMGEGRRGSLNASAKLGLLALGVARNPSATSGNMNSSLKALFIALEAYLGSRLPLSGPRGAVAVAAVAGQMQLQLLQALLGTSSSDWRPHLAPPHLGRVAREVSRPPRFWYRFTRCGHVLTGFRWWSSI